MRCVKGIALLLLLFFSCALAFDSLAPIIPSRLEGKTRGHSIHVAEIKVGSPRQTLRLALDYSGSKIYTYNTFDETDSSTYSPIGGGSDLLWVGGKRLRFPFETNPLRVSEKIIGSNPDGAPIEGLLGVGPSSPLWFIWKQATFTNGAITIGKVADIIREAEYFGRLEEPKQLDSFISCFVGFPELCRTEALVGPNLTPVTIVFSFEERLTLVPSSVYLDYVDGKNVYNTPISQWKDFSMVFTSMSNRSKYSSVKSRIRKEDLVSDTDTSGKEFNLGISPSNNTMYVGRTAWRSFALHRNWMHHDANIIDWRAQKELSNYSSFILITFAFLATWWIGSTVGEWEIPWKARGITISVLVLITILGAIIPVIPSTRESIREFLLVDIFFQLTIYLCALVNTGCILLHLFMRKGYGPNTHWMYSIIGLTFAEHLSTRAHWNKVHESTWQIRKGSKAPFTSQSVQIKYAGHPSYLKKKKFDRLLQYTPTSIGGRRDIDWDRTPPVQMLYHYSDIGSQRVWAIIGFCTNSILFTGILYAWFSTREDTLTGVGSFLLVSFFILSSCYHLFSALYHRGGRASLVWYMYIGLLTIFLVLLILLAEVYVFYPFVHRFVPDYSATPSIMSLFFILMLMYFAETVAKSLVSFRGILMHAETATKDK